MVEVVGVGDLVDVVVRGTVVVVEDNIVVVARGTVVVVVGTVVVIGSASCTAWLLMYEFNWFAWLCKAETASFISTVGAQVPGCQPLLASCFVTPLLAVIAFCTFAESE